VKPAYPGSRSKRIFIFYSLAVLLPGIVLGVLAFRGISNDQALREKQARQELSLHAQDLFGRMSNSLQVLLNNTDQTGDSIYQAILFRVRRPDSGSLQVTDNRLVFLPESLLPVMPLPEGISELEPGWVLEFREGDKEGAVEYYETLRRRDFKTMRRGEAEVEARVLAALGRLYVALDRREEAIGVYRALADSFPEVVLENGMPLGMLAMLKLSQLESVQNNEIGAKQWADRCVQSLLDARLILSEQAFDFFYREARNLPIKPDPEQLYRLEARRLQAFNLAIVLEGMPPLLSLDPYRNLYIEAKEHPAVLVQTADPDGSRRGVMVDLKEFVKLETGRFLNEIDPEGKISLKITDETGKTLFERIRPSEEAPIEFNFASGLPPWKLGMTYQSENVVSLLFNTSQGLFIFVFIFIVLLMSAGLIFMLRTLNQEIRLNKLKSDFISNVSHEFRTPLTSLRHMTEIMYLRRIDSEQRKEEYLQTMLEQCDHLGHLIDNILDFSRIELGKKSFRFGEYNLNEVLLDLIPVFRSRIPDPGFEIEYICTTVPPSMRMDKDAMQQVFYNLLDNAYKYSGEGRKILVEMDQGGGRKEEGERRKEEVIVRVTDFGIGISERELPRIFERFYRADRLRTEGIKGSGIGLTIVKQIVEAHEGEITVTSEPGKGSTFTVILPIEPYHDTDSDRRG
jgi:signal transduction histidine kinase